MGRSQRHAASRRARVAMREDSLRERSPAACGHVRDCRDMSPSLGLTRARYSRAVLEPGWHLVPRYLCYRYVMLWQRKSAGESRSAWV